jgi:hypothetical protein
VTIFGHPLWCPAAKVPEPHVTPQTLAPAPRAVYEIRATNVGILRQSCRGEGRRTHSFPLSATRISRTPRFTPRSPPVCARRCLPRWSTIPRLSGFRRMLALGWYTASLPCPLLAWALVAPIVLGFFDNGKFMLIFFFWVRSQNFRIIHPIGFSKDQNRTKLYITKSYSQLCDRTKRRGAVSWPSLGPDSQVTYSCKANHSPGTWRTRHPPNNVTGRAAPPRQPASIRTRSTVRAIS